MTDEAPTKRRGHRKVLRYSKQIVDHEFKCEGATPAAPPCCVESKRT